MRKKVRVDDACLAQHADTLSRVIIALGLTDTAAFWEQVRRLPPRVFEASVEAFEKTGNLDEFREQPARPKKRANGHWKSYENVETELRAITERLGRFPKRSDLEACGHGSLAVSIITYHGGLNTVAAKMGFEARKLKNGHWKSWENVEQALNEIIAETGSFPSELDLERAGKSGLLSGIANYHGGSIAVREKMGHAYGQKKSGHWSVRANAEQAMREIVAQLGHYPIFDELQELGHMGLVTAINDKYGGLITFGISLGFEFDRVSFGHWNEWTNVEAALRDAIERLDGRFPTTLDLRDLGYSGLPGPIMRTHGGYDAVRKRMGYQPSRNVDGHWKSWENAEAALMEIVRESGHFPTWAELGQAQYQGLRSGIAHNHGGLRVVRKRMGYDPISDTELERHADMLAQIIPTLGLTDTSLLWDRLKAIWLERDLNKAIEDYERDGSVTRFRALLDG